MELLSLLFMSSCFLTLSGLTFGDQSGGPVIVKEGDYAILPCSLGTNENTEFVRFEWTKEGTKKVFIYDNRRGHSPALPDRVLHSPDLKHGSASIRINKVQLEDRGNYTCDFPSKGKTFRIELLVVEKSDSAPQEKSDSAPQEKSDSAPQVIPVWAAILIGVLVAVVKV